MTKKPRSVLITLGLIILNSLVWFVLGSLILFNLHPGLPDLAGMKTALAIISFVISTALLIIVYFLNRQNRAAHSLALVFYIFLSILTIFDDIGEADLVFLVICLIPTVLLIKAWKWYRNTASMAKGE